MNARDILNAMNEVEEKYIEEAAEGVEERVIPMAGCRKRKPFRQNGAAVAAACVLLVLGGGIYGRWRSGLTGSAVSEAVPYGISEEATAASQKEEADAAGAESVQSPNPFQSFRTLSEAETAAGFRVAAPESYAAYTVQDFSVLLGEGDGAGNMIELIYRDASGEEGLRIRVEKAENADISGDYNFYERDFTEQFGGRSVRVRGSAERIYLLSWTEEDYSYAVSFENGVENTKKAEAEALIAGISAEA